MTHMVDDPDIYRAASLLIRRHHGEASAYAATRAEELLKEGDVEGQTVWKRILKVIDELLATERPLGAVVN